MLCKTKKVQSDLRTGLGRPVTGCTYMHRYLVRRIPEVMHPDSRRAYYAVASLIADRPRGTRDAEAQGDGADTAWQQESEQAPSWYKRSNLGALLAQGVNAGVMKPGSAENDLHLMARQSSETIHRRLPALLRQLQRGDVTVEWAVLLEDLAWWNRDRDRVATRWLDSYFRTRTYEDEKTPADENVENS